jgi:catechol 2,3-dioxygenase-like lactoylglutathione lyase family enzyme
MVMAGDEKEEGRLGLFAARKPCSGRGGETAVSCDFGGERTEMFSHVMVGSDDIARSKTFYDALFGAIGGKPGAQDAKGRLIYAHNGGLFLVSKPIDGKAATHANGGTIGFAISPEQADAWHKAGVANGGTAIEDPPGVRQGGAGPMYLAYLRDPDGNKLCALHRMPAA